MKNLINATAVVLVTLLFVNCKSNQPAAPANTLPTLSADDNKIIIQREISTWEFGKTKNFDGLREILADDYQAFFGKNVMNENDVIRTFQNSIIRSYHLSNIRVKPIAENAAVIYYELDQDVMDENGDKWTPLVASSTIYVKRNNVWRAVFYQETEIKN